MLHQRLSAAARAAAGDDYEIVLVNDGSRDGTLGDHAAAGRRRSAPRRGQSVAQPRPSAGADRRARPVPRRRRPDHRRRPSGPARAAAPRCSRRCAREQADVVYGVRKSRAGETAFKRATAHGFYRLLSRATEVDIPVDAGDFRLMSRRALDALLAMPEQARFIRGMVAWIGFKQVPLPYNRDQRFAGETKYPLRKMIRFAFDALTGFSSAPLKLASHAGLCAVGRLGAAHRLHLRRLAVGPERPGLDLADAGRGRARRDPDVRPGADGRISRPALQRGQAAGRCTSSRRSPDSARAARPAVGSECIASARRSSGGEARRSAAG